MEGTTSGSVIGTWAHMAPERFSAEADWRADIYALACVLHECLTGARPFPGNSMEQQIAGHVASPPPRPSAMGAGVPPATDEVIAPGMTKSPADRYQAATDLAKAALLMRNGGDESGPEHCFAAQPPPSRVCERRPWSVPRCPTNWAALPPRGLRSGQLSCFRPSPPWIWNRSCQDLADA